MFAKEAYISLGSNQGNTVLNLKVARGKIFGLPEVEPGPISGIYYTEPQGVKDQPWFANQVLKVSCSQAWTARSFLHSLLNIETEMGRVRQRHWGPRKIDLDLLSFTDDRFRSKELTLPHPRMYSRAFVLVPLQEIAPDYFLEGGVSLRQALSRLDYRLEGKNIWQKG